MDLLAARRWWRGGGLGRDRLGGVGRLDRRSGRGPLLALLAGDNLPGGRPGLGESGQWPAKLAANGQKEQQDGPHGPAKAYAQATHDELLPKRLRSAWADYG